MAGPELLSQELPLREWKLEALAKAKAQLEGTGVARPELALGATKDC